MRRRSHKDRRHRAAQPSERTGVASPSRGDPYPETFGGGFPTPVSFDGTLRFPGHSLVGGSLVHHAPAPTLQIAFHLKAVRPPPMTSSAEPAGKDRTPCRSRFGIERCPGYSGTYSRFASHFGAPDRYPGRIGIPPRWTPSASLVERWASGHAGVWRIIWKSLAGVEGESAFINRQCPLAAARSEIPPARLAVQISRFGAQIERRAGSRKIAPEVSCGFAGVGDGALYRLHPVLCRDVAGHGRASSRGNPERTDVRSGSRRGFRRPRRIQGRQTGGCGSATASGPGDCGDRGSKVLRTHRCRSSRHIAGRVAKFTGWRYARGRQHHHAAARPPDVSLSGTLIPPKGPGSASRAVAGESTEEGRHPSAISQHRLFWCRRLRCRRCRQKVLREESR